MIAVALGQQSCLSTVAAAIARNGTMQVMSGASKKISPSSRLTYVAMVRVVYQPTQGTTPQIDLGRISWLSQMHAGSSVSPSGRCRLGERSVVIWPFDLRLRQDAVDFCTHWPPIMQAQREGTLDLDSISQDDQDFLDHFNVPVMLGWVSAMLDWPVIEPLDFLCPALWIAGSDDHHAIASIKKYEESLKGSMVQVHIVVGLDHNQLFDEIETVFPIMLAFTKS
jgi:pimeloyl-ACP methyl ester carboxylesterase